MAKKSSSRKPAPRPAAAPAAKPAPATKPARTAKDPSVSTKTALPAWRNWALAALVITALCYIPSLSNGLVNWDDDPNITENPNLEVINGQSIRNIFDIEKGAVIGNYNPLPIFTFAIEKAVAGKFNTTLIHTTNLVLHLATVFFVFLLLLRLGLGNAGAFIGALLFGIHPMRVESVAWATERKDVLFAVFYFAALLLYIRWFQTNDTKTRTRLYAGMAMLALLSLFSKVQAVTLPLSMLALDYFYRRPLTLQRIWEKAPFWLLSLVFGLINIYTLKQQGSINEDTVHFTIIDRLCIGAYSFLVYLYKLVLPYPMSPLYPYPKPIPIEIYLAPIGFIAFWFGVYRLWKADQRWWVFGILFFFFNVMFLLQVLGAGQGFLADRFTYVPYFGFFAIAGFYYEKFTARESSKTLVQAVAGIFFLMSAFLTFRQIKVWKNGDTLWSHVIKFEGNSNSLPFWNRGQYLREKGDFERALQDYNQAITINPKNPELYNSRGKTYFDMAMSGKYKQQAAQLSNQAMTDYNAALALEIREPKTKAELLINRGAAFGAAQRYEDALRDLSEGIQLNPANKNGYFNRSIIYFQSQQYDKAIADYTEYLKYDPNNDNIWYERGMLRRALKQNDQAVEDLNRAVQLNPSFGIAYRERARAYLQSGNRAAAQADYQRAAQLGAPMEPLDQQIAGGK